MCQLDLDRWHNPPKAPVQRDHAPRLLFGVQRFRVYGLRFSASAVNLRA